MSNKNAKKDLLDSLYAQTGYSKKGKDIKRMAIYKYKEPSSSLMKYKKNEGNQGKSEYIKEFNLDESEMEIILGVITRSAAYQRTSQKSMMATRSSTMIPPETNQEFSNMFKDSESLVQTRQTHMREVADLSRLIAGGLGLNRHLAYTTGLLHDIGHTWNGHTGERILSAIARYNDCGYIVHNAMGAYIMGREKIIETAIKSVKQMIPDADEKEIKRFMLYVIDGVVSHNGEGMVGKIIPQNKSFKEMEEELKRCFTINGYDKKIMPATLEGGIIRYADIIAYTRSDILDGFRLKNYKGEKILQDFDNEYLSLIGTLLARRDNNERMLDLETKLILETNKLKENMKELTNRGELNLTPDERKELGYLKTESRILDAKYKEFIEYKISYAKKYINGIKNKSERKMEVTNMMQNVFVMDLVEASKDKNYITMSPLIRRTLFALRDLNVRKIVPYTRRTFESKELPIATKKLVDIFANTLLETGLVYRAMPDSKKAELGITEETKFKPEPENGFEKKICHYYDRLEKGKLKVIYENSLRAIEDITRNDVEVALGMQKYEGELKEIYESDKIIDIRDRIHKMGKNEETMTGADKEKLIKELIQEKQKNIAKSVAAKMAIEYIGGMTDNTILSVLIDKNLISRKQLVEGYGRGEEGTPIDAGVQNLQKVFSNSDQMIKPDNIEEDQISL